MKRLGLFAVLFAILAGFYIDPDFGWHVAIGQHFMETGEVLRGDIFSWTMNGYVWGNSYFLYQAGIAYLLQTVGYGFLVLIFALVGALGFSLLVKEVNLQNSLLAVLGALSSRANLGVRPHMISFLFFAMLLIFLEKKLYRKVPLNILVFLGFALWANIHRGFIFAIFVYAVYLGFGYLRDKKLEREAVLSFVVAILGSFVTPFPLKLYTSGVADDFRTIENLLYVAEWQPAALFYPVNVLLALTGTVFIYMFLVVGRKFNPVWFMTAAVSFSLAFLAVSLLSFWSAIFVFVSSRYFEIKMPFSLEIGFREKAVVYSVSVLCAVAVILNSVTIGFERWTVESSLKKSEYPVDALHFVKSNSISGNMLNTYEWGGYLLWQAPDFPVFVDGRMAGWKMNGESILGDYVDIFSGKCESLNKYDIQFVLTTADQETPCFQNFSEVYKDDLAKVLVKS